ncbi:UdgX family uracil-DNA binding protein [Devosia sp. MC1541]|uniref:UdgX family uracil-DNA binding protein n=1 Tax=Devosia sp. MC1541 TaxID=2725264 RepID=UPI00145D431E|nr:UdgX family uracil-DNA binding protein [Devosia sp. MC1541]
MLAIRLSKPNDLEEWRGKARRLLVAGVAPHDVVWRFGTDQNGLFEAGEELLPEANGPVGAVPKEFMELARGAIQHSDPARFDGLYRLLWRLQKDRSLVHVASDRDMLLLTRLASGVRRDSHKMKAFVRFRRLEDESCANGEHFVSWFEPEHFVLETTAPFFARRFASMDWAIITPYASAFWDTETLTFGPGGQKSDVPQEDSVEDDWRTYYRSIFNPARLKVSMMKSEMPVKYWKNLPEAEEIGSLIRDAKAMEVQMIAQASSQPPSRHMRMQDRVVAAQPVDIETLADAREAIHSCKNCPLHEFATQPVFGEGPENAEVLFVGEQPGDSEDLAGKPFIGPAGQVFDEVLGRVRIDRKKIYVTNAVKHFKFEPRGKRRIHQRPTAGEVQACRFWLDMEIAMVKPKIIVALGATAAESLFGRRGVSIAESRGKPFALDNGALLFVTNHPSYLLRLPDPAVRQEEMEKFQSDLTLVRNLMMEKDIHSLGAEALDFKSRRF